MSADTTENQRLLPVLDELGLLAGAMTRSELTEALVAVFRTYACRFAEIGS